MIITFFSVFDYPMISVYQDVSVLKLLFTYIDRYGYYMAWGNWEHQTKYVRTMRNKQAKWLLIDHYKACIDPEIKNTKRENADKKVLELLDKTNNWIQWWSGTKKPRK